ncbi:MAG: hypothetical protein EXS38_07045 [Opitutus sp.]|nr:hypothetical protein [Opitutus sp.]
MSPQLSLLCFPLFGARRLIRFAGLGAALLVWIPGHAAAPSVPDAPTVSPAPIVDQPLTPAINDTPGEQPSPQHAWVPGHWRWSEGAYVWEAGRWEMPPVPNLSWVPPQWLKQGNGYVLKEGYWDEVAPKPAVAAAPQPPQEIIVAEPPPPPQREVIYERPTPVHVWIGGYWGWWAGRHVWIGGRWEMPPRTSMVWVPARWDFRGGRYVLVEGYWREVAVVSTPPPHQVVVAGPPPGQVTVVLAPPPPRREVAYGRPGQGYFWVNGYWAWRARRHVWIGGHWEMPPRGYRTWVEPRWERRGGNYIFIEGRWGR